MVYEARHAKTFNLVLAVAVLGVSLIGFAAAQIIPNNSGYYPLVGWTIIIVCFAASAEFVRRAFSDKVLARIDAEGVLAPGIGARLVPWSEITGFSVLGAGAQRIARFERREGRTFGINPSFYDRRIGDLLAAVRHYRPDLGA